MARKRKSSTKGRSKPSSKKESRPSALPPPVSSRRSYMQRWRDNRALGLDTERWAKLELQLGRFAQIAGIVSGFVLGFAVFLVSVLTDPGLPILATLDPQDIALWTPLVLLSFAVSGYTVAKKIGPYRSGRTAGHFASSLAAFGVSSAFLVIVLLGFFKFVDLTPYRGWLYPGSSLGLALAFISLAVTWEGFGWQKVGSITCAAAIPLSLAIIPIANVVDPTGLTLLFAYDAIFVVVAGSLLHLLASSGEATQREILKASDSKIMILKDEISNKVKALDYKEKAYVQREAHLDAKEKDLLDIERELDARTHELNGVQSKLDSQGRTLGELEGRLAKMRADVETKVEELSRKEKDLKAIRAQIEGARQDLAAREASLGERDKELKRMHIEVSSRERAIEGKSAQLEDLEARLRKDSADFDRRRDEVIRKQKELELKESEVSLKLEQLEARETTEFKEKTKQLQDWESKILAKERDLGKLEINVRQLQEELNQQRAEADAYASALEQEREALQAREQDLVAKEKGISDRDAGIDEKAAEVDRRWQEVLELKKRIDRREAEYNSMFKDAKMREATFETTREEVTRRSAALQSQEARMKEWQANLGAETKKLQDKYREMLSREKAIEAKESELSLKELEITTREREAPRAVAAAGASTSDQQRHLELWEKRLKEKEEGLKRRMYQKEKEFEAREMALREQLKAAMPEGELAEAKAEVDVQPGDRLRTGTPRLDDLLYGGLPMNANILFIGPAFVGKEVAILNFIADGLRSNVPSIILTTSKPPVEIAKDMAPVLPTFMEYEQLGLVRWIDASGSTPAQRLVREGNTYHVPNAADFDGIVQAVNEADEEFREQGAPYFRFAFLTLSASLTQADEKEALAFVQQFVNRLRQSKCVAAFALERGMHTDRLVESLQNLVDGAILFRQDKSKTLLSVVGVGEVQTRDWVPYKFTNKALMVGSFQLERIR